MCVCLNHIFEYIYLNHFSYSFLLRHSCSIFQQLTLTLVEFVALRRFHVPAEVDIPIKEKYIIMLDTYTSLYIVLYYIIDLFFFAVLELCSFPMQFSIISLFSSNTESAI